MVTEKIWRVIVMGLRYLVWCVVLGGFSGTAQASVIVSEIMYNPNGDDRLDGAGGFNKEWIELFNTGTQTIDLGGWYIGDSQDAQYASPFPAGTLLAPQKALVVTGDAATFDQQWGSGIPRVQVNNFPSWANTPSATNEIVALRDNTGAFRDIVNFQAGGDWPIVDGAHGQSIMAVPQGLGANTNDIGTNWVGSTAGVYGGRYRNSGELGENHASPGVVVTKAQAPFAPSPDAVWSIAVIPDSQNYVKSSQHRNNFTEMTQWIRDHRQEFKIGLVLHEGDIVNNNDTNDPTSGDQVSSEQWANARTSMTVLNGHVPYIMAAGNHDFGTTNAQNRNTEINNYFKATDNPLVNPAFGGILKGQMTAGRIENAYYEYIAPDGRPILVMALEWEPRPATVAWANSIVSKPEYADHTAILLTHAFVTGDEQRYSSSKVAADADGQQLWTELVRGNENFELVFNGHFGGDGSGYVGSTGAHGNFVHQMFFNAQQLGEGGGGWMRLVEFLEDGKTIRVRSFSTLTGLERTNSANSFELPISLFEAGDFNGDGRVDLADYTVWRDTMGTTNSAADANGDGRVDGKDYSIWKVNFGRRMTSASVDMVQNVPEPVGLVLVVGGLMLLGALRRARSVWE